MSEDFIKSIKANLYDRTSSPLFGTFVFAWSVWNYKMLFVLFSSMTAHEKFDYIDTFLYPDFWVCLIQGGVLPIFTSIIFIFLYPYPAKYVYEFSRKKQKELKEIKQIIDDDTPLTKEEAQEIRRESLKQESEYDSEVSKKNIEIDRLKSLIKSLENEISGFKMTKKGEVKTTTKKANTKASEDFKERPIRDNTKTIRKVPDKKIADKIKKDVVEIDTDQIEIMIKMTELGGYVKTSDARVLGDFGQVKLEFYIEDLMSKHFIEKDYNAAKGGNVYKLSTKAKKLMIDKGIAI